MHHQFHNLGNYVEQQIHKELKEIPEGTTSIGMDNNKLEKLLPEQLITIIRALPNTVKKLYLQDNALNRLSVDNWIALLQALGPNINYLDISHIDFSGYSASDLARIFAAIPNTVTHLDISNTKLGHFKAKDLILILNALHKKLDSLDLGFNELSGLSTDLIQVFEKLDLSINRLFLTANNLGIFTDEYLGAFFKVLPKVAYLYLSHNAFAGHHVRPLTEFGKLLFNLPTTVVSIDLASNFALYAITDEEIDNFFNTLPSHIRSVDLAPPPYFMSANTDIQSRISPLGYRIAKEIKLLEPYQSWKNSGLVALGLQEPSDAKIAALIVLQAIFNADAKNPEPSDEKLKRAVIEWCIEHNDTICKARNRVKRLFSSNVPASTTQLMIEDILTRLVVNLAADAKEGNALN